MILPPSTVEFEVFRKVIDNPGVHTIRTLHKYERPFARCLEGLFGTRERPRMAEETGLSGSPERQAIPHRKGRDDMWK